MKNIKRGLALFLSVLMLVSSNSIAYAAETLSGNQVFEDAQETLSANEIGKENVILEEIEIEGKEAATVTAENLTFTYELVKKRDENNELVYDEEGNVVKVAKILSCNGSVSKLVIPSEIEGHTVEIIGSDAFSEGVFSEVIMPDTILTIEHEAFNKCGSLENIVFSKSLMKMGEYAFGNCNSLEKVTIPASLVNGGKYAYTGPAGTNDYKWGAFHSCLNLKTIEFEEGTTLIASNLFANCTSLESITIPDTVKEIAPYAFFNCDNLTNVVFSAKENLTLINSYAFEDCDKLQTIEIPDSVKRINNYAFSDCDSLKEVQLSKVEELGGGAFYNCDSLEAIKIPKSLTKTPTAVDIGVVNGKFIFSECDNLKTVTFEEGITEIADGLFFKCKSLESIEIPDTVTKIGASAFEDCTFLNEIKIPSALQEIETKAFYGCAGITEMNFPDSVTKLGNSVFAECTALKSVDLANVQTIGAQVFYNCDSLESIEIPKSLKMVNSSLDQTYKIFGECDNLKTVTFEEGTTIVAQGLFNYCSSLESIVLPDTVTSIKAKAFSYCTNLKSIQIPKSVTTIANTAFNGIEKLTIYGFAGTVAEELANTDTTKYTFVDLTVPATSVILSSSSLILNVGEKVQLGMTITPENYTDDILWTSSNEDVVTVDGEGNITAVGKGTAAITVAVGELEPVSCEVTVIQPVTKIVLNKTSLILKTTKTTQLTATVSPTNANNRAVVWSSSNNNVATVNSSGLVTAKSAGTAVITATAADGSGVKAICQVNVQTVLVGENYTVSNLKYKITNANTNGTGTVTVTGGTKKTITSLKIGSTVKIKGVSFKITAIGDSAFKGYTKLKKVTMGSNVTTIGNKAFYGCTALTSVSGCTKVTSIGSSSFYNCKKLTKIGSKSGRITLPAVNTIGSSAFKKCVAIKYVNLSSKNLTSIGSSAFYGCTALKTVVISSTKLTTIGSKCFYKCKSLSALTIKSSKLTKSKVGSSAFKGIKSTCTFKVPKSKFSSYKSIFKAKGASSKLVVKKY